MCHSYNCYKETALFTLLLQKGSCKVNLGEFKSDQKYFAK